MSDKNYYVNFAHWDGAGSFYQAKREKRLSRLGIRDTHPGVGGLLRALALSIFLSPPLPPYKPYTPCPIHFPPTRPLCSPCPIYIPPPRADYFFYFFLDLVTGLI